MEVTQVWTNVYDYEKLKEAIEDPYPRKVIQIIDSFAILDTLTINTGTVAMERLRLDDEPIVLSRGPDLLAELFIVDSNSNVTFSDIVLDGYIGNVKTSTLINTSGALHVYHSTLQNNNSIGNAGAINVNSGTLEVVNSTLQNNTSNGNGGAINTQNTIGTLVIEDSNFINNHAGGNGGAVCDREEATVLNNTTFINNTAGGNGGGLYYDGFISVDVEDCRFENNTAAYSGGGMYLSQGGPYGTPIFHLVGYSVFIGNRAFVDGGAIWVYDRTQLNVDGAEFHNNRAAQGYFLDPADQLAYSQHVHAIAVTAPFTAAWNNFDINYQSNLPFIEDICNVVGTQTVDLCMPVTVTPSALIGPTTVRCCGAPVVSSGLQCVGAVGQNCEFTIRQTLCIEVPVDFSALVTPGPLHTDCGTPSATDTCDNICG